MWFTFVTARRFIHRLLPLAPRGATVDDVFGREPPNSTGRTFTCVSARFAGCCARTPKLRFAVAAALCRRRGGASSANKRQEAQVHIAAPTERGGYKNAGPCTKLCVVFREGFGVRV